MKTRRHIGILMIFGLLISCNLHSQDVKVDASLDTSAIKIGEQTMLHLKVRYSGQKNVQFPVLADTMLAPIEVVAPEGRDTSRDEKHISVTQSYRITAFDSGYHMLPPLPFISGSDSAFSEPVLLRVQTLEVDTTTAIKPIKGIRDVPLRFRDILPYILGGILLIIIVLGILYYLRKRKGKAPVFSSPPRPQLPPAEEALQRLEELEDKKLWQHDQHKKYYIELTAIIRHYIERRYEVEAEELSSSETLEQMRSLTNEDSLQHLKILLERADLVKFARLTPMPDENHQAYQSARAFVENTRMKEVEPDKNQEE